MTLFSPHTTVQTVHMIITGVKDSP